MQRLADPPPAVYAFPGSVAAPLSEVGGKGLSLIKAAQAGLPVPPGFVLPVGFFAPWLAELKAGRRWADFLKTAPQDLQRACDALKRAATALPFTDEQTKVLSAALASCRSEGLLAVRSSSPQEDLEGASFAGGYQTVLGVTAPRLHEAIRQAFASCLDHRVVVYKRENGFDPADPRIAVIVQQQIASDVAGVAFSLNPLTNSYDQALVTSNWGLGETVVAGTVTPDSFIVDKVARRITERALGAKQASVHLEPHGGTRLLRGHRRDELTLSDGQVLRLLALLEKVERLYGLPMDIEWAFCGGQLYLLQARPITGYVPLPPEMITQPGAPRRLYLDITTSTQGISRPLSRMGLSVLKRLLGALGRMLYLRDTTRDIDRTVLWASGGRLYSNLSYLLALLGRDRVLTFLPILDPVAGKAVERADLTAYRSRASRLSLAPLGLAWLLPLVFWRMLEARRDPQRVHRRCQEALHQFRAKARALASATMPLGELAVRLLTLTVRNGWMWTSPLFIASLVALAGIKRLAGELDRDELDRLTGSLPNNVTTEMGLQLHHLSRLLPEGLGGPELLAGIRARTLPAAFMASWEQFLDDYGHRGAEEIDVAAPRYREDPRFLLDLLASMRGPGGEDAQERFTARQHLRRRTYQAVRERIATRSVRQAKRFQSLYAVFETFAGYRETDKFCIVIALDLLRQRIMKEAEALVAAGRLESVRQVFRLTLEELDAGIADPTVNLAELARRKTFSDRLARAGRLPAVIDSRGLILRAPAPPAGGGVAVGSPVSAGLARGPVKVLHAPDEKPLAKGDVLVARVTDPGWTPLFVNAAAVVLEIGGPLQHGALVAREYGLPCVTGVADATTLWPDGTLVEVDGASGTVRTLPDGSPPTAPAAPVR